MCLNRNLTDSCAAEAGLTGITQVCEAPRVHHLNDTQRHRFFLYHMVEVSEFDKRQKNGV